MKSAVNKVAKEDIGYQRSPSLAGKDLALNFWKAVLSAKTCQHTLGQVQVDQVAECDIDLSWVSELNIRSTIKERFETVSRNCGTSKRMPLPEE